MRFVCTPGGATPALRRRQRTRRSGGSALPASLAPPAPWATPAARAPPGAACAGAARRAAADGRVGRLAPTDGGEKAREPRSGVGFELARLLSWTPKGVDYRILFVRVQHLKHTYCVCIYIYIYSDIYKDDVFVFLRFSVLRMVRSMDCETRVSLQSPRRERERELPQHEAGGVCFLGFLGHGRKVGTSRSLHNDPRLLSLAKGDMP